jgi:hypothetical protein
MYTNVKDFEHKLCFTEPVTGLGYTLGDFFSNSSPIGDVYLCKASLWHSVNNQDCIVSQFYGFVTTVLLFRAKSAGCVPESTLLNEFNVERFFGLKLKDDNKAVHKVFKVKHYHVKNIEDALIKLFVCLFVCLFVS